MPLKLTQSQLQNQIKHQSKAFFIRFMANFEVNMDHDNLPFSKIGPQFLMCNSR